MQITAGAVKQALERAEKSEQAFRVARAEVIKQIVTLWLQKYPKQDDRTDGTRRDHWDAISTEVGQYRNKLNQMVSLNSPWGTTQVALHFICWHIVQQPDVNEAMALVCAHITSPTCRCGVSWRKLRTALDAGLHCQEVCGNEEEDASTNEEYDAPTNEEPA